MNIEGTGGGILRARIRIMNERFIPEFPVASIDAAIPWYQRLGFDLEWEHSSGVAVERRTAGVKRGELRLTLAERDGKGERGVALLFVADIAPIADEFGVDSKRVPQGRFVELDDPDGNRIRVVSPAQTWAK
jgi:hypothetical protein